MIWPPVTAVLKDQLTRSLRQTDLLLYVALIFILGPRKYSRKARGHIVRGKLGTMPINNFKGITC